MMKKTIAVFMTVMMLLSAMAVFASAGAVNSVNTVKTLLNKNFPNASYLVTTGAASNTKVQCSKDGCKNEEFTQNMFYCNMCSKYFCPDHIINHLTGDHKIVAAVCSVSGCNFKSGIVYCQHCGKYFCLDHYVSQGHMLHQSGGQSNYCSIHQCPYVRCDVCGLSYCVQCNPYHSLSHSTETAPAQECAIGGCGVTTNLRYCSLHGRWFCQSHFVSEGHASHGTGTTAKYCSIHKAYYVSCVKCGEIYCPQCTTHTCKQQSTPSADMCPVHGTKYTVCATCGASYCARCNVHICTASDLCGKHLTKFIICSNCGIKYCPQCTSHSCLAATTCPLHNVSYLTCTKCGEKYCPKCTTHVCNQSMYCSIHKTYFVRCGVCGDKYCPYCTIHRCSGTTNYCSLHNTFYVKCSLCGQTYCPKCTNHVCNSSISSVFYPLASTPSGKVAAGTKISFTTNSEFKIFYTTDGTTPTRSGKLYISPITIEKDTLIKAVAMRISNFALSPVVTYEYKVVASINFTDVASIKGLEDALHKLVGIDAVKNETKFNPEKGFTFAELKTALTALGVDMTKLKLDKKYYSENGEMTYQEFAYVTYKALKFDKVISNAKNGTKTLKTLKYNAELPKVSIIKASFASLIENGLCYELDFKPADKCTRAFMAMSLGAAYDIINED